MMTAEFLWINIPLMVLAFALWVGIPMWMVLRRPDRDPRETRTVPAYLRQRGVLPPFPAAAADARGRPMPSGANWFRAAGANGFRGVMPGKRRWRETFSRLARYYRLPNRYGAREVNSHFYG